jgi:hypothetical protein
MAQRSKLGRGTEITERGNIYFFYRPRVQLEHAEGMEDVQRFFVVLSPHGGDLHRILRIGKKTLPALSGREHYEARNWGFVETVARDIAGLEEVLGESDYGTDTGGERVQPAARPAGEGVYAIVRGDRDTRLYYVLELPEEPGEVQRALNVAAEGAYILSVKNPESRSPRGAGLEEERQADYPPELQKAFGGRRWIAAHPTALLDYEGAEFVLIGLEEEVPAELADELKPEHETESSAEIFKELHLSKSEHPVKPLFEGAWD